jgi:hypothetical protein
MRRFWLLALSSVLGCGDSGGATDGTDSDTDTDTETLGTTMGPTSPGTDDTSITATTPTTATTPSTVTSITITSAESSGSGTTGPVEPGAYVHAAFGADSNPGTPDEPVRTIQRGIQVAAESGFISVFVAAGDYPVASDAGDIVEVIDGITLQGGYSPDDWGVRNPASFMSRIVDTATLAAGATAANPHRALYVPPGLGAETRIDGFVIEAAPISNSAAVVVDAGSTPVIVASTLLGGGGAFSTAIYLAGGSPRMFRNSLDGIASADGFPAFAVRGVDCAPNFAGNIIRSGDGTNNRTISLTGCGGVFANNVVFGERGLGGGTRAFELVDCTSSIVSNTIVVDSTNTGFFVLAAGATGPAVLSSNNFVQVSTATWCYSHGDGIDVASLHNNNFGCQNIYAGAAVFNTVPELEAAHPDAGDNVDLESGVVDPVSDWHLRDDGTTLCGVARGGIDVGVAGTTDIEGTARTEPWSIGAYELDSSCL